MNSRIMGIVLLALGIVLLAFAVSAADSFSSFISETFEGTPSARTVFLLIAGVVASVLGLVRLLRSPAVR